MTTKPTTRIDPSDLNMVPVRVSGIPAFAYITYYQPPERATGTHGEVFSYHDLHPGAGAEVEFELYDRKGYRAKWLEGKATNIDNDIIADACINYLSTPNDPF